MREELSGQASEKLQQQLDELTSSKDKEIEDLRTEMAMKLSQVDSVSTDNLEKAEKEFMQ